MLNDIRLTERLREFRKSLNEVHPEEADAALASITFGPPEVSRVMVDKEKIMRRTVYLDALPAACPPSLREDARLVVKHCALEGATRGELWTGEGLYRAVADLLGIKIPA